MLFSFYFDIVDTRRSLRKNGYLELRLDIFREDSSETHEKIEYFLLLSHFSYLTKLVFSIFHANVTHDSYLINYEKLFRV